MRLRPRTRREVHRIALGGLAGTPAQHARERGMYARGFRMGSADFRRLIRQGRCDAALSTLLALASTAGKHYVSKSWSNEKLRSTRTATALVNKLKARFLRACSLRGK